MPKENLHADHRQRMREKFLAADESHTADDTFRDHELLEILLFYSQPRVNTNETAHRLLSQFGSLRKVIEAPYIKLTEVKGVGKKTAIMLRVFCAVMRRCIREEAPPLSQCSLCSLPELVPVIRRMYAAETAEEHVFLMLFDADGMHIKSVRISDGTPTGVSLDIPRCVRLAVQYSAAAVLLVHNHPSSAQPSNEDIAMTAELRGALHSVRIEMREHLVITNDACYGILRGSIIPEHTVR